MLKKVLDSLYFNLFIYALLLVGVVLVFSFSNESFIFVSGKLLGYCLIVLFFALYIIRELLGWNSKTKLQRVLLVIQFFIALAITIVPWILMYSDTYFKGDMYLFLAFLFEATICFERSKIQSFAWLFIAVWRLVLFLSCL